jgi:hypothetical protein
MNKIVIGALAIALYTGAVSCNSSNAKGDETYSDNSSKAANNIIAYTNAIVDLSNSHNSYLERVISNTDRIEKGLQNPNDRFAFTALITPFVTSSFKSKDATGEPAKELSSDDKKFFKENVSSYMTVFERIKTTYKDLDQYIKAEDFKDDKGEKGKLFVDSLHHDVQLAYSLKGTLMKRVNEVADASEEVILKDSPMKDYVIAMKSDMKAIRQFIDYTYENGNNYAAAAPKIKEQYDALEAAKAKHEKLDQDKAKEAHKDSQFRSFYEKMTSLLGDARKMMRTGAEKGVLTENDLSSLESDYDYMITTYNSFNS